MTTLWKSVNFTSAYANATTIGYQLYDKSMQAVGQRTPASETPAGSGIFGAVINFPQNFRGYIQWDTGDGVYATDDVNLTDRNFLGA